MTTNTNLTIHKIKSLISLIYSKSLVYQYSGELLNVAEENDITELTEQINSANEIKIVSKGVLQNYAFDELVGWANENDILICVDQYLIICVPKVEYEKVA